ncbi:MAG: zinc ribbon domain-containing protein [Acidobacteria bacterium]|nr:MAG: zinc ribbon domain-containing protein [Acidobacteriota bacterium]
MPIYEFYCHDCHTVFNFFSSRVDPEARPDCPRCGRPRLPRRPSRFATLSQRGDEPPDPLAGVDDARLEGAMETLMQEMEGAPADDDPRLMGRMMRRFSNLTGLELGETMEEMVRRLEAGEDPEQLEEELGQGEESDDLDGFFQLKRAVQARHARPRHDEQLYFL